VIVDTGILVALADRDDRNHRAAAAVFALPDPKIGARAGRGRGRLE